MLGNIRRFTSGWCPGLAALFLLAACTATTSFEATTNNREAGGGVTAITAERTQAVDEANTATNELSRAGESETEAPATEVVEQATAAMATAESVEEMVRETEVAAGGLDTTIVTDTRIFTTDNRSDRLRRLTAAWETDWEKRTIDYDEVLSGGPPRDGIPSIDAPKFVGFDEASAWLADNEPVIALEINGDARAYPLQVLTWHEIANDKVGDIPIMVTFCPLCNSALVFDRRVNGEVVEFGVSGLLRNSDLIMYDRGTETLWQQFTGEAIVGELAGRQLRFLPSAIVSYADFRAAHPDGVILSRDTGFSRQYGLNPYVGYDAVGQNPFLFTGILDGRLPAMERVVTVPLDEIDAAYPLTILSEVGAINDSQGGQDLVVFHSGGTSSALGAQVIAEAADVGATGVFDPHVDGEKLNFAKKGDAIIDVETGSVWNILGQAIEGPLTGKELVPIIHADQFWFSWAAFKPDTIIYQE